jgi:hypothetical protein
MQVNLMYPAEDWGAAKRGWDTQEHATDTILFASSVVNTGEPARDVKEGGRREGRPDPKPPRPSRPSNGAEESERGKAAYMAKALRERVGQQYTGTQRTRKAVHGELLRGAGEMDLSHNIPLS